MDTLNGNKITGNVPGNYSIMVPYTNLDIDSVQDDKDSSSVFIKSRCNSNAFIDTNSYIGMNVPYADLSTELDLTADKIVYGNNILGVEGTAVNTSDATAVANNIEQGIIAYGANGKLTGSLQSGDANIIVDTITTPDYYFLNDFNGYQNNIQRYIFFWIYFK